MFLDTGRKDFTKLPIICWGDFTLRMIAMIVHIANRLTEYCSFLIALIKSLINYKRLDRENNRLEFCLNKMMFCFKAKGSIVLRKNNHSGKYFII